MNTEVTTGAQWDYMFLTDYFMFLFRGKEAKDSFVGSSLRVVDVCTEALLC